MHEDFAYDIWHCPRIQYSKNENEPIVSIIEFLSCSFYPIV